MGSGGTEILSVVIKDNFVILDLRYVVAYCAATATLFPNGGVNG